MAVEKLPFSIIFTKIQKRRGELNTVDFHTHILPKADHGSDCVETAVAQLTMAKAAGIDSIIATSHFYPHRHEALAFLKRRKDAFDKLKASGAMPDIDVRLGAEVLLCSGIERLPNLDKLCFEGTNIILIELPFSDFIPEYEDSVRALCDMGYEVILAHADRYHPRNIETLLLPGVKIQLNAEGLCGVFKNKTLYKWIDAGLVVGIGSDIHMIDKMAYKQYLKAKFKLGKGRFEKIMTASNEIFNRISKA